MKNLVKCAFLAMSVGVFAIPASADSYVMAPMNVQDTVVKKDTIVKENAPMFLAQNEVTYAKIEVAEMPEVVSSAVSAKYEGWAISEAFKGSDNSYKLLIKKDGSTLTVYFTQAGEFVKEETGVAKADGVMLI